MFRFSRHIGKASLMMTTLATMGVFTLASGQAAMAQGQGQGGGGGIFRRSIGAQAVNACYTTNFGDIAAKALGITVVDIRKALVNGETLQQIATDHNVDYQTVTTAITTARNTEIDQSVKDGVITQDEATGMEATPPPPTTQAAPTAEATQDQTAPEATADANAGNRPQRQGQGNNAPFPDISTFNRLLQQASGTAPTGNGPRGGFGGNTAMFNLVQPYAVVAQSVSMKCTDLVKDMITPPGKSARMVASDQKIDPQTVTDALVKAYKDALAQDVTDSVITQAQADTITPLIQTAVDTFVGNPLPMGPQVAPTPAS